MNKTDKQKIKRNPYLHLPYKFAYDFLLNTWAKSKCKKMNTTFDVQLEGLKPPFIVLANHASIADYSLVTYGMKGYRVNLVGAVSQTLGGKEILFRLLGVLKKRQFAPSMALVKEMKYLLDRGGVVLLYPEARLTGDGRCSHIPISAAKMFKLFKVPIVTMKTEGAYFYMNKWRTGLRETRTRVTVRQTATAEDSTVLSVEQLHGRITEALSYNEWEYQRREQLRIPSPCSNMHTILYRCPVCKSESTMTSSDYALHCTHCNSTFTMDEYGVITCPDKSETDFCTWYDEQVKSVREEIEKGKYCFEDECEIELFESKEYVALGKGRVVHDITGITFEVGERHLHFDAKHSYAIPYDCAQCIYLSTPDATYKITPIHKKVLCTKISLAVEQIYDYYNK